MKTRSRKTDSQENQPDVSTTKTVLRSSTRKVNPKSPPHEVGENVRKRPVLREKTNLNSSELSNGAKKVNPKSPPHEVGENIRKRPVLREKTNLNTSELSSVNTSLKKICEVKSRKLVTSTPRCSPKQSIVTPKGSARQRETSRGLSKTPSPKENSFRREVREKGISQLGSASKERLVPLKVGTPRSSVSNNTTLNSSSLRRKCVYMTAIPEDNVVKDKEELYEFVPDKNEPPSKRRRKRTVKYRRKPVGFPRRRNHSETSCSSVSAASSTGSSILKPPKKGTTRKKDQVVSFCASISSTCSSIAGTKPPTKVTKPVPPVPILYSSNNSKSDLPPLPASFSSFPSSTPNIAAPTRKEDVTIQGNHSMNPPPIEFQSVEDCDFQDADDSVPIILPPVSPKNPKLPATPTKNSFGNSSIWSERPSMCLGMANLHSTPCKARSGSDTSSIHQLDETNCNKENCFGFSSDEEDAGPMMSPLRMSPHLHAHRHNLLSPQNAPSRFSPLTMKRMLVLREGSSRQNVNSSSANNHKRKLQFQEKAKPVKKVVKRAPKKAKVESKKNIVSAFAAAQEKVDETRSDPQPGTPSQAAESDCKKSIAECLFEDLEAKEAEDLTVRHPRRSYERPLKKKNKKVAGGGLCLLSDDEDDHLEEVEKKKEVVVDEKKKPQAHHPRRKGQKMEKELDNWASLMNMQFGEVEDFDLCIDKKFE